jgi:hypothetical protein
MSSGITIALSTVFVASGLVHLYWVMGGAWGKAAAVPELNDHPAFVPSKAATLVVAVFLLLCALLIAAFGGLLPTPLPQWLLTGLSYGLAAALFLRAVGDFRLVGFFKRVRGTDFARRDTMFYAPLCFILAVGVFALGQLHGA